jgi:hypothetical protein
MLTLKNLNRITGVIIGRGGASIATMRTESNVKAGVSKVVPGVADRILSIGGTVDGVAKVSSYYLRGACLKMEKNGTHRVSHIIRLTPSSLKRSLITLPLLKTRRHQLPPLPLQLPSDFSSLIC